jgi:hypothetical protein
MDISRAQARGYRAIFCCHLILPGTANQHRAPFLKTKMQFGRIARMQIPGTLVGNVAAIFMAIYHYGDRAAGASCDPQAHSALLFGACTSVGEAGLLVLDDE